MYCSKSHIFIRIKMAKCQQYLPITASLLCSSFSFSPYCTLILCCWYLHVHCIKSEHLEILKFIVLHHFSGKLAVVVMCGTAVLCVQLPWYGLSHLTWQSQANVFTPWNDYPPPLLPACVSQLCLPSFPLLILCSFEIINMQGWHGLYSEFRQLTLCLLVYWSSFPIICLIAVNLNHKIESAALKWCFRCSGRSSLVWIHLTSDLKKLHIFSLFIWNPLRARVKWDTIKHHRNIIWFSFHRKAWALNVVQ